MDTHSNGHHPRTLRGCPKRGTRLPSDRRVRYNGFQYRVRTRLRQQDEQGVDVNAKKALILAGAALLVFFLVTQPVQSAGIVTQILNTLKDAAEALITFVRSVFSG